MKTIKILKGLSFILTGITMFGIKFYNISYSVMAGTIGMTFAEAVQYTSKYSVSYFDDYFNQFFKLTGTNLILALLFIAIGIFELIETKGVK
jgi:hypothetical protein